MRNESASRSETIEERVEDVERVAQYIVCIKCKYRLEMNLLRGQRPSKSEVLCKSAVVELVETTISKNCLEALFKFAVVKFVETIKLKDI